MTKAGIVFLLFLISFQLVAQETPGYPQYRSPLDIPLYLSGTFAELRSNHFHSGIDIRTQGVEGKPVFAIGDGFVSRIAVSPFGFGKALYINHPEGYTSVYAHLQRFSPEIEAWVKQQQYAAKSYGVNLYLTADQFVVKKSEQIGKSGNSGSSGGPHLHFEIRDAASQEPLNPLYFGYQIKDYIRPAINMFAVYPITDFTADSAAALSLVNGAAKPLYLPVEGWGEQHRLPQHQLVYGNGKLAFGISVIDQHNDSPNKNGVYSLKLKQDNRVLFKYTADRFSFSETRFINSFIDYGYYVEKQKRLIRTQLDPLNKLGLYESGEGMLTLKPGDTVHMEFVVEDFHRNISRLPFVLVGRNWPTENQVLPKPEEGLLVEAGSAFELVKDDFFLKIPSTAFYRDEYITLGQDVDTNYLSMVYAIGKAVIPVHKAYQLGIRIPENTIAAKVYMVIIDRKGKKTALTSTLRDGFIEASPREMGNFALLADTVSPQVRPLNFKSGKLLAGINKLKISIKDDESGIDDYSASLNGEWLLMAYDAKNEVIIYEIDERLKKGNNNLIVNVRDKVGNSTLLEAVLVY
ncbi:MAG: M23 family metallopeptidase [Bacteroidetes bacterium]|nr:M23 family metallopeptidase [Bacteroidota bacterium]MBU1579693.1 M23 family metallopeptidase [Bacteroidota bacterium]MBU2465317.1 M23 family metallopeptidase [Bacteroidota bacterium]MBU2558954.1 M23 family metallopeptidase [Bacteroidota bacterium]